jgi:ABC-type uncharacterized transport system ATPase subunit
MSSADFLQFNAITKSFGNFVANSSVSFTVKKGSIHGLVGENGAGKSTLMNILFGRLIADSGHISINGKNVKIKSSAQARKLEIGMVHQHFNLADSLTPLDHLVMSEGSKFLSGFTFINEKSKLAEAEALSKKYSLPMRWEVPIKFHSVESQQRLELLKILHQGAQILILDEPTAVLSPGATDSFLNNLKALRDLGKTIIFISHKLPEVLKICDHITVLRKGECVGSFENTNLSPQALAKIIVGKDLPEITNQTRVPETETKMVQFTDVSLSADGRRLLDKLSFTLHKNEILGVAGVEGNGQSQMVDLLVGSHSNYNLNYQGEISLMGKLLNRSRKKSYSSLGLGLIPMDRIHQGLFGHMGLAENFIFSSHGSEKWFRWGILQTKGLKLALQEMMDFFKVRIPGLQCQLLDLSGGNQQKFVVGRELRSEPAVLIACHPSRGVDIGAKSLIHSQLLELKSRDSSVILVSSDLDELFNLSDRILVFYRGKVAGVVSKPFTDKAHVGSLMTGGKSV